jgi:hypothetical protein
MVIRVAEFQQPGFCSFRIPSNALSDDPIVFESQNVQVFGRQLSLELALFRTVDEISF